MTDNELKNIAPNLFQLKELGSGFSVPNDYFETIETTLTFEILNSKVEQVFISPEHYFESLEDTVLNKIHVNDELFSIPERYFESIEDSVLEKIYNQPKVISLRSRIIKQFIPIVAAASLLLFISLQFYNSNNTKIDLFASLETSEIENWIENEEFGLYYYDIAAIYEDEDIENLGINSLYEDDEILNYLDNIDVESLILTN